jgi:hypothetical protein
MVRNNSVIAAFGSLLRFLQKLADFADRSQSIIWSSDAGLFGGAW